MAGNWQSGIRTVEPGYRPFPRISVYFIAADGTPCKIGTCSVGDEEIDMKPLYRAAKEHFPGYDFEVHMFDTPEDEDAFKKERGLS